MNWLIWYPFLFPNIFHCCFYLFPSFVIEEIQLLLSPFSLFNYYIMGYLTCFSIAIYSWKSHLSFLRETFRWWGGPFWNGLYYSYDHQPSFFWGLGPGACIWDDRLNSEYFRKERRKLSKICQFRSLFKTWFRSFSTCETGWPHCDILVAFEIYSPSYILIQSGCLSVSTHDRYCILYHLFNKPNPFYKEGNIYCVGTLLGFACHVWSEVPLSVAWMQLLQASQWLLNTPISVTCL